MLIVFKNIDIDYIIYISYICPIKQKIIQMKKAIFLLSVPAILFFASCGGSKTEETVSMPGMMEVSLKINGNSLSIMVPDSTKGKMEMVEQSWGATEIKVGKEFQISISESEGDVALMKSDIAGNDVNKFKRFLKDEPSLLFWESEITEPEFHFYSVIKTGNASYLIENIKEEHFTEKSTQTMIDASKTLKLKETANPNS